VHTWFTPLAKASFADMENQYQDMERRGRAGISHAPNRAHVDLQEIVVSRGADMRYVGQEHAVSVELPTELFKSQDRDGIKRCFDAVHDTRYGYASPGEAAEIVSLRCAVVGLMKKPREQHTEAGAAEPPPKAFSGNRLVYFASAGFVETPTYDRAQLVASNKIKGPALIEEYASTTVLMPGDVVDVDALGNLVISVGGRR